MPPPLASIGKMNRIVRRHKTNRTSTCSLFRFSTSDAFFSRRALSPLVKAIHPDMFVRESQLIQRTNLKCLQALNEMCDSIEGLDNKSDDVVEINKPLKPVYTFDCHMFVHSDYPAKEASSSSSGSTSSRITSTKAVQVIIKTPTTLCGRNRLSPQAVSQALDILLSQLSIFFKHANLESPYTISRPRPDKKFDGKQDGNFFLEDKSIVNLHQLQKDVDAQTMDAYLTRRDRAIRSHAFTSTGSKADVKRHWILMNEEVLSYDIFISSSSSINPRISPMTIEYEYPQLFLLIINLKCKTVMIIQVARL